MRRTALKEGRSCVLGFQVYRFDSMNEGLRRTEFVNIDHDGYSDCRHRRRRES